MTVPIPEKTTSPSLTRRGWVLILRLKSLMLGAGARSGYRSISLTNFAASLILARNVSPTQFGVYGVGFILVHLFDAFQEGLLIQPLNTFGAALGLAEF